MGSVGQTPSVTNPQIAKILNVVDAQLLDLKNGTCKIGTTILGQLGTSQLTEGLIESSQWLNRPQIDDFMGPSYFKHGNFFPKLLRWLRFSFL